VIIDIAAKGYLLGNYVAVDFSSRLGAESSVHAGNELIVCSVCRSNIQLASGISVHAGSLFSPTSRLWERPLLCSSCKREGGMEDKLKPQLE